MPTETTADIVRDAIANADWERLASTSEADLEAAISADPDDVLLTDADFESGRAVVIVKPSTPGAAA